MPNPLTLFPATNGYRRPLYDGRAVSVYYDCHPRNEWGELSQGVKGERLRVKWEPPG